MVYAVQIKNFSKSFGKKKVIEDLSFEIKAGEVFAYLGSNGAGKTTTIRCLLDIYAPDKGQLHVYGSKYTSDRREILGYLPEERGLYLNNTVRETIAYFGQLKGMNQVDALRNTDEYIKQVGIEDLAQRRIKTLSSGQQQKVQLGLALVNKPKLLILDEPTKGLDPVNRRTLLDILIQLNQTGTTIMFSTHIMKDVEEIADQVLILKQGKIGAQGSVTELRQKHAGTKVLIKSNRMIDSPKLYTHTAEAEGEFILQPKENIETNSIIKFLVENDIKIKSFDQLAPGLEDIFINVMKNE